MNKSVALSLISLGLMLIRNSRVAPPLKLYGLESVIKSDECIVLERSKKDKFFN